MVSSWGWVGSRSRAWLAAAMEPTPSWRGRLRMGAAPDLSFAVLAHQQRAILRDRNADRAAPDLLVGDHEARHEVLVFAGRLAGFVEQQADDLVARPQAAVPGTVKRDESAAPIFRREGGAIVKGDLKRSGVGLHQHIGESDLVLEIRTRTLVTGILVCSDVVPRPAVECALLDCGGIFEGRVVAELVALVDDAPQTAGRRLDGDAGTVAQAGGDDRLVPAVRVVGKHVGAALFGVPGGAQRVCLDPGLQTALDQRLGKHIERDVRAGTDR